MTKHTGTKAIGKFSGLIALLLLFTACEPRIYDNPVDPDADSYIGYEVVDEDGDGVGSIADIDEVAALFPSQGVIVSSLPLELAATDYDETLVDRYRFQLSSSLSEFESNLLFDISSASTSTLAANSDGLENGNVYYWRVQVHSNGNWAENWSDIASFTFQIDDNHTCTSELTDNAVLSDTTPTLTWNSSLEAGQWAIEISGDPSFPEDEISGSDNLTQTGFTVPAESVLSNNTQYYWRVRALTDDLYWTEWSPVWSFSIGIPVPVVPDTRTVSFDSTPEFTWPEIEGASRYAVEIAEDDDFTTLLFNDPDVPSGNLTGTYTVPAEHLLVDNQDIYWRVRCANADGIWGDWSRGAEYEVQIPAPVTETPADTATLSDSTPLLGWQNAEGAVAFQAQISDNSAFADPFVLDMTETDALSASVSAGNAIDNKTTVFWHVRSRNADGIWGDWSATHSFRVELIPPALTAPANDSDFVSDTATVDFSWSDPGDNISIEFELSTDTGFTTLVYQTDAISGTTHAVTSAWENATAYYWRIRLANEDGISGDWLDSDTGTFTWYDASLVPGNLTASQDNTAHVHLEWGTVTDADTYNIYRADGGDAQSADYELLESGITGSTFDDSDIPVGDYHWYRVSAVFSDGSESYLSQWAEGYREYSYYTVSVYNSYGGNISIHINGSYEDYVPYQQTRNFSVREGTVTLYGYQSITNGYLAWDRTITLGPDGYEWLLTISNSTPHLN